jgi:4-hydroxybenzoate polyprenyltransferase
MSFKSLLQGLRTLLILGRVSNLPTVWSNLIVGWAFSEGDLSAFSSLALLLAGGSLLYVGGMYLNDYCDASFDAEYCRDRPIPAGKISRTTVGRLALFWFFLGLVSLASFGLATTMVALLLVAAIVLYDFHHKEITWAPWIMGFCRVLLYLAGMTAVMGLQVFSSARLLWPEYLMAITLGIYVVGITLLARGESRPQKPSRWYLIMLLMPVFVQAGVHLVFPSPPLSTFFQSWPWDITFPFDLWFAWWIPYCLLLIAWMLWLLLPFWLGKKRSVRRVVSGLLAGIILVDMIAWSGTPNATPPLLLPLFLLALLLQRVIPAT